MSKHDRFADHEEPSKDHLVVSSTPSRQADVEIFRAVISVVSRQVGQGTSAPVQGHEGALDDNERGQRQGPAVSKNMIGYQAVFSL